MQRFISEDPLGFRAGDSNLYAYVHNSPLSGADPLGLCEPPAGGVGYCIDAYIPHPGVPLPQYGPFSGDNRGPNANGGTYRTRQLILPDGASSSDAGRSTIIGTEFGLKGTAKCTATPFPLPLGGRKIFAECVGYNGFDVLDPGPLPPLYYVIVIQKNKEGVGRVVGAWGTAYPSFEVWQYSQSGSPRQLLDYQTTGTIGDLFNGGVPLPVRR